MCVYMFKIDRRNWKTPSADFGMCGYLWPGSDKFESWTIFHKFDEVMTYCHIFESVKNHINAYISYAIRDRNMKT